MGLVMGVSDRIAVLDFGAKIADGDARRRSRPTSGSSTPTSGVPSDAAGNRLDPRPLREDRGAQGRLRRGRRGRDRHPDRRATGPGRPRRSRRCPACGPCRRATSGSRATTSPGSPRTGGSSWASARPRRAAASSRGMTVLENLEMGAYSRRDRGGLAAELDRVFTLFPRLAERRDQSGGTLSGGEQQMLAIGRALMAKPTLLLLDEPSMGLAPRLVAPDLRHHHRDQPAGRHDPAGRAERDAGAPAGPPRLRAGDRAHRPAPARPSCWTTTRCAPPTSAATSKPDLAPGHRGAIDNLH